MGKNKVIVIGGGASGMVAAIFAARNGGKVTILEKKDRVGRKVLATGNGRCNLSNRKVSLDKYHSTSKRLKICENILKQFSLQDTIEFFEKLGLVVVELEDGKLYPRSLQANSVVNVLRHELNKLKIDIVYDSDVKNIEIEHNIRVITQDKKYYCNTLIMATGGKSYPDLGSNGSGFKLASKLGHDITMVFPSLVQLKTDYPYLKHLKGTKIDGTIEIVDESNHSLRKEFGEILFTDYGISGPPVLQVSRHGAMRHYKGLDTYVLIDLMSEYSRDQLGELILRRLTNLAYKSVLDSFTGMINSRLIIPVLKAADIDINKKAGDITKIERNKIVDTLKEMRMKVIGTNQWNQSQVTAGGINLNEINAKTLESKIIKNLFFCGEILDIDGDCGGYNLQWAFSSGAIAGTYAMMKE